jgi:hypothetical protein
MKVSAAQVRNNNVRESHNRCKSVIIHRGLQLLWPRHLSAVQVTGIYHSFDQDTKADAVHQRYILVIKI